MSAAPLPPPLQRFVQQLSQPCIAFDRELRACASNDAWGRTFASGDDIVGRRAEELFPTIREEWLDRLTSALDDQPGPRKIMQVPLESGAVLSVASWITPWHDNSGAVGGALVMADDITEQIAAEARQREDAELVRALFNQSPVGLNLCQTDGLWVESNQAFLDIIGYSAEEADGGLTYWQLTPRKYDDDEQVQLASLEATGRYGPYEKEFIRKDGSLVPVRLNGFFVERDGRRYIWSLIEDLTAQRTLERGIERERLKAIQASKLATIGEMAAGFAHEINNPLTIIESYAYLLGEAGADGDAALADEAVGAIREATRRAATIVQGLRRLARQDAGQPLQSEDAGLLTDEAVELCRFRFVNHGVDLSVDRATRANVRIQPVEFQQVIINLLNNAFDAVRGAREAHVRVRSWDDGQHVNVAVEDTGPGLTDEERERLFEPFFTTKPVGEGTGLGLSISRSIAQAAGGDLVLDIDAPRTCFVFTLPQSAEST